MSSNSINVHLTASDISLFHSSDEEIMNLDNNSNNSTILNKTNQCMTRTGASDDESLSQALYDALRLGMSNFLVVYNTRAGIAVLLRIFQLLQRHEWKAAMDVRQVLDEKQLHFRVDAVRLGLFVGSFTGGYRGFKALLPMILRRVLPKKQLEDGQKVKDIAVLGSGAIAAIALAFVDTKRRRSMALYALTRALQCGYNTAKRQQRWHFWGSKWQYGDVLLFALSSAQVMYAYVMRPQTLPSEYRRFIQRTGPVEKEALELVQQVNRGVPISTTTLQKLLNRKPDISRNFSLPMKIIPCRLVHANADSCVVGMMLTFKRAFQKTFPLYLSLFIVPGVVIHFKRFLRAPCRILARSTFNATRSNCFLASFVSVYLSLICLHRRVVSKDHRFIYYMAGLGASTTILLEPKSRRSELALYVLPRALDSLAMILHDRGICSGFIYGEVALFSVSMSVMMYCYEHDRESMSPLLYSTMKRFLQTSTNKKHLYIASLENKERRRSQSIAQTSTASGSA